MIELLSSTAYLIVNKKLSKKVGLQAEKDTTLSPYQQRACIAKLKGLGLITVKRKGIPAKRYFKVNAGQVMQLLNNKELIIPMTINKNKINNNNNDITIREQRFLNAVSLLDYDIDIKTEFTNYWTEKNKTQTKMKWELCSTWDTNLRLKKWVANQKKWDKPNKNTGSKLDSQLDEYNKGKAYL